MWKYGLQNAHHPWPSFGQFAMGLYYQPVCGDNLPDLKGSLSTAIPRQTIAEARGSKCDGVFTRNYRAIVT